MPFSNLSLLLYAAIVIEDFQEATFIPPYRSNILHMKASFEVLYLFFFYLTHIFGHPFHSLKGFARNEREWIHKTRSLALRLLSVTLKCHHLLRPKVWPPSCKQNRPPAAFGRQQFFCLPFIHVMDSRSLNDAHFQRD